jgi:hypothetical protein
MTTAETITGVVEARNERGIRVAGEWRNVSRFKPVELPAVGAQVELGLDPKGYITTLAVLNQGDALMPPVNGATSSRDGTITRLAVLKAAANFAAGRGDIKSSDVLRIADSWLQWVGRED